jgi:hypothetical protein
VDAAKPPGRPPTHGLRTYRRALTHLGTTKLDQRTSVAIGVKRFVADVVRDLSGDPSAQQLAVLEVAARTKVMRDAVDDWLLRQPSLLVARKRTLIPALTQRQQLATSFVQHMQALGLERKAKPVPSLAEFVREQEAAAARDGIDAEASP